MPSRACKALSSCPSFRVARTNRPPTKTAGRKTKRSKTIAAAVSMHPRVSHRSVSPLRPSFPRAGKRPHQKHSPRYPCPRAPAQMMSRFGGNATRTPGAVPAFVGRGFEVSRGEGRATHSRPSTLDNLAPPLPVKKTALRVARLRVTTGQTCRAVTRRRHREPPPHRHRARWRQLGNSRGRSSGWRRSPRRSPQERASSPSPQAIRR